jgi:hypothetical protein
MKWFIEFKDGTEMDVTEQVFDLAGTLNPDDGNSAINAIEDICDSENAVDYYFEVIK